MIARYGGEELAVLLPGASRDTAREIAERLRQAVRSAEITGLDGQRLPGVTVSIGVAQLEEGPQAGQDAAGTLAERFIEQADRALYRAKAAGRDQVA
jgi:diguanylate cyclase (GGDEF)-like protein